jgi:hypothetical protein
MLESFALSEGDRYTALIPDSELVTPNKAGAALGYRGWAYCAATRERDYALLYCEKDCPPVTIRGFPPNTRYRLFWFNPETGKWNGEPEEISTNEAGRAILPEPPFKDDAGIKLLKEENQP